MALTWAGAPWTPLTTYILGSRVVAGGNVYRASAAGISAASGGPSGTGAAITDGSVTWAYLGVATTATVVAIAPELAVTPAAPQAMILDQADRQVCPDEWGDSADVGAAYLAAHMASMRSLRGRGPVLSESEGQLSRSYQSMMDFGELGQTLYGIEYLRLVRLTPAYLGAVP